MQYVGKCGAERHLSIKGGTEQVRQLCWQATILAPYQTLCTSYYADTFASICSAICRQHNEVKFIFEIVFEIAFKIIFEIAYEIVFEIVFEFLRNIMKNSIRT